MNLVQATLLGIIQGVTEFLPISSSGHLVIAQQLFGLDATGTQLLSFDVALHFGTLMAVIAVFYRDVGDMIGGVFRVLRRPSLQSVRSDHGAFLALLVIVGTLPAAVIGIAFKDLWYDLFTSALFASFMLLITGVILWLTRYVDAVHRGLEAIGLREAVLVGLAQAVAIFPGISRSGSTIATGIFLHCNRRLAARFSFLLAIPAILGGFLLELNHLSDWSRTDLFPLLLGTTSAAISGFLAIHWLLRIVQRGHFYRFAYYCWAVGGMALIWFAIRH